MIFDYVTNRVLISTHFVSRCVTEWWGACAWRRSDEAVEMSRREKNGRAKEVKEFRNQSEFWDNRVIV